MYIPKTFITAIDALHALMQLHHADLLDLDRNLASEKEWQTRLFSVSRAPPPITTCRGAARDDYRPAPPLSPEDHERIRQLRKNLESVDAGRRDVTRRLRAALAEEELQATIIMANGTTMVIGRNVWLPDEVLDLLAQGYVKYAVFGHCQVVILRKNFEAWIKAAKDKQVVPAAKTPSTANSNKKGPKTTKKLDAAAAMVRDYQGRPDDLAKEKLITLQHRYSIGRDTAAKARRAALKQLRGCTSAD